MVYPQSTIDEIAESELRMVLDGAARYGPNYKNAFNATMYLSLCIGSFTQDRADTFGRLLALMKKQQLLALLSALRLHNVQMMMNLRQVLEAGAAAAYAIANPNVEDFVDIDDFGIMDPSAKLLGKRYKWLGERYPVASNWIKEKKDEINANSAHANIISGSRTFHVSEDGKKVSTPFFDFEDTDYVKIDLWLVGNVAVNFMSFFYGVASDVARAGGSVVEIRPDFEPMIQSMSAENESLRGAIMRSDRYKAAMQRQAQRERAAD